MTLKGYKLTEEHKKKIGNARKGQKHSKETIARMKLTHKKIKKSWLSSPRKPMSEETKLKISISNKGEKSWLKGVAGLNHPKWKGGPKKVKPKPGYRKIHKWIAEQLGKAAHCEDCGLDKIPVGMKWYFEWANKSKEYKKVLEDWKQLCRKCHRKFDKVKSI